MNSERWERLKDLFSEVLAQPAAARESFVAEACGPDQELKAELVSLLAAHERAGSYLSKPAVAVLSSAGINEPISTAAPTLPSLERGTVLAGKFWITGLIARGGMGEVYLAEDTRLNRNIAIKLLPSQSVADEASRKRLIREAQAAAKLDHPNICAIHEVVEEPSRSFIVMQYVEGETLASRIQRGPIALSEVLDIAAQVAAALAEAHAKGIIHRDIKPQNIMLIPGGRVKVLDFGLAKLAEPVNGDVLLSVDPTEMLTQPGTIVGTVAYMSPEQAEGKPVDARSDIFSFGSILYEMVAGRRAFDGESKISILAAVLHKDPEAISKIVKTIPQKLEWIIVRCLKKDPSRRWQMMTDVKVALEEMKEESVASAMAAKKSGIFGKTGRSAVAMWVALVIVVSALVAAAWFWLASTRSTNQESWFTPLPLTTDPGSEFSPSFSPDGSQVAFAWQKSEHRDDVDIYVKQIGVEELYRLTDDPAPDISPAWSPDGRSIAFARYLPGKRISYLVKPQRGGREHTIAVFDISLSADSSNGVVLRTNSLCDWMPDSRSLVVVGKDPLKDADALFMVSIDTGEMRKLTSPKPGFSDAGPAVSPDGRTLLLCRSWAEENRGDLYLLDISDNMSSQREPERLTFNNPWNGAACWLENQRDILFLSGNVYDHLYLSRMPALAPDKTQRLAFAGDSVYSAAVSRRGNRLAYSVTRGDLNIWRVPIGDGKPKAAAKLIASTRDEMEPAYSPDGRKIAFASRRSGPLEIWVCDSDGSHPVQLTSFRGPITNSPRWSPDGQLIAFYSDAKGNRDVYVIRADGGVPRQLTTNPSWDTNPEWSADGQWIYFVSDRDHAGVNKIWKVPAAGGEAVPVHGIRGGGRAAESPDGKFLYYLRGEGENAEVWGAPTGGGAESLVVGSLHPEGGWVVMEKGICFISKPDEKGTSHICFRDFATGGTRTIASIEGRVFYGLTVSPDRHSILYTHSDDGGRNLMLVENFR